MAFYIVDDNECFLNSFQNQLRQAVKNTSISSHSPICCYKESKDFVSDLEENALSKERNVLFLDIMLSNESGFPLAEWICAKFPNIKLVFISSLLENVINIFDYKPAYFLVKPISQAKLADCLRKITAEFDEQERDNIVIKKKGKLYQINKSEICYIESHGRQLEIHMITHNKPKIISCYGKLSEIINETGQNFVLCHKSYLVNLCHVYTINKLEVHLYSGEIIPVSRRRLSEVKEAFFSYLGQSL